MGSVSSTFCEKVFDESYLCKHESEILRTNVLRKKKNSVTLGYLPPIGFAAAMTEQRAWRDVTIPAFDMLMLCCSMASCILTLQL